MQSNRVKLYSYAIGYTGQGVTYNYMSAYFVIFLTNCVGLGSTVAGTIASVALFFEVAAGIIVGNLSDNCQSKLGRRRPFLLVSAICMPVLMILLSQTVGESGVGIFESSQKTAVIYYLLLSIFFRIIFSTFEIPNNAFGAEIATGYDERTRLRTITRIFSITGNAMGYVMPLIALNQFQENQQKGWQMIGLIMAITTIISWFGEYLMTGILKLDNPKQNSQKGNKSGRNILINYYELLKLRPMRLLMVYKAAFACAFAVFNVATIYYLKYNLGLKNDISMYIWIFNIVIFIVMTPIANKMALKFGKTSQQMTTMLIAASIGIIVYLFTKGNLVASVIYIGAFSMMQTSFWQLSSSIFYDLVEVDEYINDKRREGDIMSFVSVLGTLITAVIVQIFGILLDNAGFDPSVEIQNDSVLQFLEFSYILVPSICFVIGFVSLKMFPINKDVFNRLKEAIEQRHLGLDYDRNILK